MKNIDIKEVTGKDIHLLQNIGRQTFSETFSSANTEENMKKYVEEEFSKEKLASELLNPNSKFYFALLDNNVIGYLKLNFGKSQTELKEEGGMEIERIYVLQEFHGKKVGQLLYEKGMQMARQRNAHLHLVRCLGRECTGNKILHEEWLR
jgi:GNAT superfamily N-acetyltransferase